jgi:hypothetical protein
MRPQYDRAAYVAGRQTAIDSHVDFTAEAVRLARAYVLSRSPDGTEEAMQVLWGFFRGVYEARQAPEPHD